MRNIILLSMLVIGLAGCSGSRPTTADDGSQREPTFDDLLRELPASETFDETAYPASMPVMDVEIDHDVPAELMDGSVGASAGGQQSGYRIQVAFARGKSSGRPGGRRNSYLAQTNARPKPANSCISAKPTRS